MVGEKTNSHICVVAVDQTGKALLVSSLPSLLEYDEFANGVYLEENVGAHHAHAIPTVPGLYSCKVWIKYFQSNHPQDPEEWDADIWLTDVEKLVGINEYTGEAHLAALEAKPKVLEGVCIILGNADNVGDIIVPEGVLLDEDVDRVPVNLNFDANQPVGEAKLYRKDGAIYGDITLSNNKDVVEFMGNEGVKLYPAPSLLITDATMWGGSRRVNKCSIVSVSLVMGQINTSIPPINFESLKK